MRGFIIFSIIFFIFDGWLWWLGLTTYPSALGGNPASAVYAMIAAFLLLGYIFVSSQYLYNHYLNRPRTQKIVGRRRARTYFAVIFGGFFILFSGLMLLMSQDPWYAHLGVPQVPTMGMFANFVTILGASIFLGGILWTLKENIVIETQEDRYLMKRNKDLQHARSLEIARRFEDAARIYERYEMYEEAGRVRAQGEVIRVKETKVSVDLNDLLKRAKDGGFVVVYRCPNCGGNIRISGDTNVDSLRTCQYCGAIMKTIDLVEYLKSAFE